ncbi:Uncharacterised protein [[Pasteurella] mairii]|uniref:Uncharacterized protein n=1 Tax=[Pasteurella] mairii TaxID=757 RepID=A0A379B0B7_9PAST|nr:Uncharacterised protein [[Pasteurella] mairii]
MINPINEMKKDNVIDEQTEIMVAQTLNRELKGQHRLTKMRTEIHKINQAKSLCPPKAYAPLSDSRIEKHEHKKRGTSQLGKGALS